MRGEEVTLNRAAAESVRRGHPWVWRSAVSGGLGRCRAGQTVRVTGPDGASLGWGIADPDSPIAVRIWAVGDAPLDDRLLDARIRAAFEIRRRLFADGGTTAYRLLHGEGDRMPGFVLDRYDSVAVLRPDGEAAGALAERVAPHLWRALEPLGVRTLVRRHTSKGSAARSEVLAGAPPPATIAVKEDAVPFLVDLERGQKTGAFLDQRENRRRVADLTLALGPTARVLNLFSYAGGFSLRAALAGAQRVTSVDIAAGAHATAQASFKLAGVEPRGHEFVTADAFAFLAEAKQAGNRWDLVVSDPPSFAPSEKAVGRAVSAYRALHRACADVLADGGVLCAASCSSHVNAEMFAATLDDGALGRSDLRLLSLEGPGADHPTLPAWPEGRYLKFAVLG